MKIKSAEIQQNKMSHKTVLAKDSAKYQEQQEICTFTHELAKGYWALLSSPEWVVTLSVNTYSWARSPCASSSISAECSLFFSNLYVYHAVVYLNGTPGDMSLPVYTTYSG